MPAKHLKPAILVVGSDGLIGGALLERLKRAGDSVLGTTRRLDAVSTDNLFLDLSASVDSWQPPCDVSAAVICAGISKIDRCALEPEATRRVNVEGVYQLARNLTERGAFVVYLSTNQVFDGSRPNRLQEETPSPMTEYGRQRAEAEGRLLALGDATSVVRLTKVAQPSMPLLQGWVDALRRNEPIHPFKDMVMAPVPLYFVVTALEQIIKERVAGIIQISGEKDITYAQAAYYLAQRAGASEELVQPISVKDAGIPAEAAPVFTTLDTRRLREELGLAPPCVWTTIDSAVSL